MSSRKPKHAPNECSIVMRHSLLVYVAHAPAVALLYNGQKPLLIIFARALCCAHSSLSAHNQMSFKKISNPKLNCSKCIVNWREYQLAERGPMLRTAETSPSYPLFTWIKSKKSSSYQFITSWKLSVLVFWTQQLPQTMQNTVTHRGRPTLNKSIAEFTHNSIINKTKQKNSTQLSLQ